MRNFIEVTNGQSLQKIAINIDSIVVVQPSRVGFSCGQSYDINSSIIVSCKECNNNTHTKEYQVSETYEKVKKLIEAAR